MLPASTGEAAFKEPLRKPHYALRAVSTNPGLSGAVSNIQLPISMRVVVQDHLRRHAAVGGLGHQSGDSHRDRRRIRLARAKRLQLTTESIGTEIFSLPLGRFAIDDAALERFQKGQPVR